ncbi:MAG: MlaD family protein [Aurantimonas endophytica]|uniref:MlaD family protein n=1 Tax=Aurantimonas endophytica TaxID=1522175 RepID=UPI0030039099
METKANYVRVGIFTLVVLVLAFAFVYWSIFASQGDSRVPLLVRIEGSVTGLQQGSQVLFNGLPVGAVQSLRIDPNNPRVVIASTQVDPDLPIKETTQANIGFQGLTGFAFIELKGGAADEPDIIKEAQQQGTVPIIRANPSDITDILATARDIADRANTILGEFESIVAGAGPSISVTLENVSKTSENIEQFTSSLASNSDDIDEFLQSLSRLANTANTVAEGLPDAISEVQAILAAVDPAAIRTTVSNVAAMSETLRAQSDNVESVVASVQTAADSVGEVGEIISRNTPQIDRFLAGLGPITETATRVAERLDTTLETANRVVAAVDPAAVSTAIDDIAATASNVSSLTQSISTQREAINSAIAGVANSAQNVNRITTTIAGRSSEIDGLLASLGPITENISAASRQVNETVASADALINSIDATTVNEVIGDVRNVTSALSSKTPEVQSIIDGVDQTVRTLEATLNGFSETRAQVDTLLASIDPGQVNRAVENVSSATDNVARAADSIAGVADSIGERREDINDIITNVELTSQRISAASQRIDSVVTSVNDLLAGANDGTSLGTDVATTLRSIRAAAQSIQAEVTPISANLQRFTGQGLREFQTLVRDVTQSVGRIDRAVDDFSNNPSRLIYGGDEVKQFDGRTRR